MTADERIEKLLNHFGQTIADLPKPENLGNGFFKARYCNESRHVAANSVLQCVVPGALDIDQQDKGSTLMALEDYICHLADVIDRMEVALETALRILSMSCYLCAENDDCEQSCCDYMIDDVLLYDRVTRYTDDAD